MTVPLLLEHFDKLISTPEDVEQLNHFVLQLAIQGRLVEQETNDEVAQDLIKRMQLAKARKIEPIHQSDIPYTLPKNWVWVRTGDLFAITGGGTPSTRVSEYWDGDIPWITSADILNPRNIRRRKTITKAGLENSTTNLVPPASVIVVTRVGLGKVALTDFSVCISQDSHALIADREFIFPEYALYCMLVAAQSFQEYSRGTTISGITRKQLEDVPFPLPPYQEQIRIVQKINDVLARTRLLAEQLTHSRTELDRLNESALAHLLESETPEEFNERWCFIAEHFDLLTSAPEHIAPLRQSILELAVRGKLTRREAGDEPANDLLKRIRDEKAALLAEGKIKKTREPAPTIRPDKLYDLPPSWVWCKIEDIGAAVNNAIVDGPFGSNLVLSDYDDFGEYPVISISNIDEGFNLAKLRKVNQKKFDELKRSAVNPGDLLVAKIGSSWGKVGMYPIDMPVGIIPANLLKITVSCHVLKGYVRLFLRSKTQRNQLEKLVKFTAQPAFNVTAFKQLLFPLPPLAEQERIVKRVEQLLGWCDALEAQLKSAEEERGRLVESVLAGVGGRDGE